MNYKHAAEQPQLIWTRGDTQERYLWDGVVWPLFAIDHDILHLTGPFLFPHDVTLLHSYWNVVLVSLLTQRGAAQCPLYLFSEVSTETEANCVVF